MPKILNLASLKAKADAAGVGTTATSTTPNLCPLKSAIAGYVTNGSSIVSISGTWADNLLVPEDNVAVNKTITGTTTVYRNVSVGSLQGGADVPAKGGSSRVYKVVTYEYATQTNYSDGTSTIGSYLSGSTTVYGSYVTGSNLGTTVKARTKIGTSTATQTVAGTSVSVSGDIYLAENKVVTTYAKYRNVTVGTPTASDISAAGGQLRASAVVSYEEANVSVYSSESESVGQYTSKTSTIYGAYVSASNLGTNFNVRTAKGTSTPSGYVAGGTRTASAVTVYLQVNCIASISPVPSEGHSYHVSYANIIGSGGSSSPVAWGRATYTFTSGSTVTSGSTTPMYGVSATFSRTYNRMVINPDLDFIHTGAGVITANVNPGSTVRTATISATLTVSISYTTPLAGTYTACSPGELTLEIPCILDVSTTGYDVLIRGPENKRTPIAYFYNNSNTLLGTAHIRIFTDAMGRMRHTEWANTGVATKIQIEFNSDSIKYLKIIDMLTSITYLPKTLITGSTMFTLTTSINTSDFNSNNRDLIFDYSMS